MTSVASVLVGWVSVISSPQMPTYRDFRKMMQDEIT